MTDINQTTPPAPPPPPAEKPKRKRQQSRSARWAEAVGKADQILAGLIEEVAELEAALADLRSIQEEYEEWKDNLPENLASSPLGEKLEEVCNYDLDGAADAIRDAIEQVQSTVEDAANAELPQGFGRD